MVVLAMAIILLFSTLAAAAGTVTRLAGNDRYETAAQIAGAGWTNSDYALLAYGENFPDALAAAPLAYKYDAPILLTRSNDLPEETKDILTLLQVKNIIIIGGPGVIFMPVEAELTAMGLNVSRVYGFDRYDTAVEVAKQITVSGRPTELFVVAGEDFPDALSVGSVAAFKQMPIILTPKDSLPDSVKNYLSTENINKSYIIGNTNVISGSVGHQFPEAERISGADRYERNIAVLQKFAAEYDPENICIATGELFADALTGAVYSAKLKAPVVLINDDPPALTERYYQQAGKTAANAFVFGGTGIIRENVILNLHNISPETSELGEAVLEIYEQDAPLAEFDDLDEIPVLKQYAMEILALVNVERAKAGLPSLAPMELLNSAADVRAREAEILFAHERPDGRRSLTLVDDFNIAYNARGENIAKNYETPAKAMAAWMNSEGHRHNIMNPIYTTLGVGVYMNESGILYWAQLFIG